MAVKQIDVYGGRCRLLYDTLGQCGYQRCQCASDYFYYDDVCGQQGKERKYY